MKLLRYGEVGFEKTAVVIGGEIIDAGGVSQHFDEDFFTRGGMTALESWVEGGCVGGTEILDKVRVGAPIARPSKIVCVGKNYAEHAKEFGGEVPTEPVLFMKATSSYSGPFDEVETPVGSTHLDYEVELAVVIGKKAKNVTEESAAEYIAGYSVIGDYSEREFQKHRCGQWTKGKSADTFAPMGPHLVSCDEVGDVGDLPIWTKVNGEIRQNANTSDMVFSVPYLVSYISQFMTLLPGDVIATGTPSGVGMGMLPPRYLQSGDLVEMGIDGIGEIAQRIVGSGC
ncbi:MAG: 2,4-diketo-3-deoxy-L-fuconate hydrolase [Rubritalea sp.]|jgi:2,4-diketo-3-deoxy-L-fuconate hydrolase